MFATFEFASDSVINILLLVIFLLVLILLKIKRNWIEKCLWSFCGSELKPDVIP
jgi:hypothetical protein